MYINAIIIIIIIYSFVYFAARVVTGPTRSVSLENLHRECGWTSLAERRKQQKLTFMFKTMNGFVSPYISDLISPTHTHPVIREVTNYPL